MATRIVFQRSVVVLGLLLALFCGRSQAADVERQAAELLSRIGTDRGICVLLDREPVELALAIARQSNLIVYVQLPMQKRTDAVRRRIDPTGLLGTRIYVEQGPWKQIHLADNLADAVIIPLRVPMTASDRDELVRVVRPLGKVLLEKDELIKPWPKEAGDWSHAYHGPDNNPQSGDRLARAPYLTQFLSEPWYVPFPEVTVTSRGRVFKAFGHVGYKERDWPWVNTLVAVNGYNGTLLWKRSLEEGFNIHRNSMIATPEVLYVADSKSCKLLDPETGKQKGRIVAPEGSTGPVWKWMAIEDGILYALVGGEEFPDKTLRSTRTTSGWPWRPMTAGYDRPDYPWGLGRTFFAIDLGTKKTLWVHVEKEPIDGRAVAMTAGRIYCYSHSKFLACLSTKDGKPIWRNADAKLLEAIGPHHRAQTASLGFSSSAYMKCSQKAIYFAGPQRTRLVAASTDDGHMLWDYPHGNFQLVLRDEGLYAMGRTGPSKLFDPLTGKVLREITAHRGNCTRATGTIDSIFTRGYRHGGTTRLAVANNHPQRIALMRPDCHDGVIVAGGMLYWGPWMCDCSISLVGIICLGPAGDFQFEAEAVEAERLQSFPAATSEPVKSLEAAPGDWPAYRANNRRTAAGSVTIPEKIKIAWQIKPPAAIDQAAPVTAGGLVFTSGSDGVVRALDATNGKCHWKGFTAGSITYPPTICNGRLFVGSGDGRVYAFEAATGKPLWQFRAAPAERKISLYGRLASTWPVAAGVLVDDDVVYAAAGIASYDGTHVYALDARTGRIRWQNNTSGSLGGEDRLTGVSVQGHLLLDRERLYLAGGNVVSPAVYDTKDGRCLNTLEDEWAKAPRGRELFVVGGKVVAFDRLLYSPKRYWQGRYFSAGRLLQADSDEALIRGADRLVVRVDPASAAEKKPKTIWKCELFRRPVALALGANAVVLADAAKSDGTIAALALEDGRVLWRYSLPARPVPWGLALDRDGRIVLVLEDGSIQCFAAAE